MNITWKTLVIGLLALQAVSAHHDHEQNKALALLSANAVCQEAKLALSYQLLGAIASDQIPDQLVDVDAECSEFHKRLGELEENP